MHPCPRCGKSFTKRSNMIIHERLHTGEMPYTCRYAGCGKKYKWLSSINFHENRCALRDQGDSPQSQATLQPQQQLKTDDELPTLNQDTLRSRSSRSEDEEEEEDPGCGMSFASPSGFRQATGASDYVVSADATGSTSRRAGNKSGTNCSSRSSSGSHGTKSSAAPVSNFSRDCQFLNSLDSGMFNGISEDRNAFSAQFTQNWNAREDIPAEAGDMIARKGIELSLPSFVASRGRKLPFAQNYFQSGDVDVAAGFTHNHPYHPGMTMTVGHCRKTARQAHEYATLPSSPMSPTEPVAGNIGCDSELVPTACLRFIGQKPGAKCAGSAFSSIDLNYALSEAQEPSIGGVAPPFKSSSRHPTDLSEKDPGSPDSVSSAVSLELGGLFVSVPVDDIASFSRIEPSHNAPFSPVTPVVPSIDCNTNEKSDLILDDFCLAGVDFLPSGALTPPESHVDAASSGLISEVFSAVPDGIFEIDSVSPAEAVLF